MQTFEYRVIPAPAQGEKARGVKTTPDRMALALTNVMNAQARDGWEYVGSETLPAEERTGLTGRRSVYVNLLVFRRAANADRLEASETDKAEKPPLRLRGLTGFARQDTAPPPAPPVVPAVEGQAPKLGPAIDPDEERP